MELLSEHPDWCRRGTLVLQNLIPVHAQRFSKNVCEFHDWFSLPPPRFPNSLL
jgi:hypothetical protein